MMFRVLTDEEIDEAIGIYSSYHSLPDFRKDLCQAQLDLDRKQFVELLKKWESSRKDVDFVTIIIDKQEWSTLQKGGG